MTTLPSPSHKGGSSEQTQVNFRAGMPPVFFSAALTARASPSPCTFENSTALALDGSIRRAAPIDENSVAPGYASALRMRRAFDRTESMASIT